MPDPATNPNPAEPQASSQPKAAPRRKKTVEEMNEYFYNQTTLHKIMFVFSFLLLLGYIAMIWQDYDREWKDYQRRFNALDLAKVQHDLQAAEEKIKKTDEERLKQGEKTLADLDAEILKVDKGQKDHETEFTYGGKTVKMSHQQIEDEITAIKGEYELKQRQLNFTRSVRDSYRSKFEIAKEKFMKAEESHDLTMKREYEEELGHFRKLLDEKNKEEVENRVELENVEARNNTLLAAMAQIEKELDDLKAERNRLAKERDMLKTRFEKEKPGLTNSLRDAPLIDFLAPRLKIEQVVVDKIDDDLHFTKVPKVERCHTCHKGIVNPVFEADEKTGEFKNAFLQDYMRKTYPHEEERKKYTQVFKTHPKLDLYLGSSSKHPLDRFGCTVCHGGDGTSTEFAWAVHTPNSKKQEEEWKFLNGYKHRELWEHPMVQKKFVYSSCRQCHKAEVEVETAKPYNTGKLMFERLGCYGCHKVEGYSTLAKDVPALEPGKLDASQRARRPGPPLTHIKDKITPEWTVKWLRDPKGFRHTTKMPKFFGQTNSRGPEFDDAMMVSIVKYLFNRSDSRSEPEPTGKGDVARGEKMVQTLGCRACHIVGAGEDRPVDADHGQTSIITEFGPNLNGVGSKLSRAWLYGWVRDPKQHWSDTRMPDLRLSDQEALDITDYLLTLKNPEFDKKPGIPKLNDKIVDQMILEFQKARPIMEARKQLEELSKDPERKLAWLGEKMVRNFGCYGCHLVEDRDKWRVVPGEVDAALEKQAGPDRHQVWAFLRDENQFRDALAKVEMDPRTLDLLIEEDLQRTRGLDEVRAKAEVKAMSADKKKEWLTEPDTSAQDPVVALVGPMKHMGLKHVRIDRSSDWVNQEGIGVELSGPQAIGSKFVDRFDFGYLREKIPETRHDWIANKLKNPRVFDVDETGQISKLDSKPPDELLRMPNFNLTEYEITQLMNFILSLKSEEVPMESVKRLSADEAALNRGARLVRDNNCKACHRLSLDRFLVAEIDPEGNERRRFWLEGDATYFGDMVNKGTIEGMGEVYRAPLMVDHTTLQRTMEAQPLPVDGEASVTMPDGRDVTMRLKVIERLPPDGGEIFEHIFLYKLRQSGKGDLADKVTDPAASMDDKLTVISDNIDKFRSRFPPLLVTQGHKVQSDWLFQFLKTPYPLRPVLTHTDDGLNVRMPTFGFSDEQSNSLVRYFAVRDKAPYPYETMLERDEARIRDRQDIIRKVYEDKDVNIKECLKCHVAGDKFPTGDAPAPDLYETGRRLKPNWLRAWFTDPARIYPGTVMPQPPPGVQKNLDAVIELLMNFEHFHKSASSAPEEKPSQKPPEKSPQK